MPNGEIPSTRKIKKVTKTEDEQRKNKNVNCSLNAECNQLNLSAGVI